MVTTRTKEDAYFSKRQIEVIAGLSAGFSTTIVMHPLDLIKVRLQLSSGTSNHRFKLFYDVISNIKKSAIQDFQNYKQQQHVPGIKHIILSRSVLPHTILQYYRGILPNVVGNIVGWSLYFTLYAEFKNRINFSNPTANYFTSSTAAGVTTGLLTSPIWVLKTRILGTTKNEVGAYKSAIEGIKQMLATEGVRSFWKGTIPGLFLVFQASLQFTFYDNIKHYQLSKRHESDQRLSTVEYILSSALSKILSTVITYPSQVVKSRLQNSTTKKMSILAVCRSIWHNEGHWQGFYKGVGTNMLRVVPATCLTFVTYETVKDMLSRW